MMTLMDGTIDIDINIGFTKRDLSLPTTSSFVSITILDHRHHTHHLVPSEECV